MWFNEHTNLLFIDILIDCREDRFVLIGSTVNTMLFNSFPQNLNSIKQTFSFCSITQELYPRSPWIYLETITNLLTFTFHLWVVFHLFSFNDHSFSPNIICFLIQKGCRIVFFSCKWNTRTWFLERKHLNKYKVQWD